MFRNATAMSSVYSGTTGYDPSPYINSSANFFDQEVLVLTWTNVPADGRTVNIPLTGSGYVSGIDLIEWDNNARVDISSNQLFFNEVFMQEV